jgi:JAKMIP CC3 domain
MNSNEQSTHALHSSLSLLLPRQEQNNNFMDNDRFQDRVMYLEEREKRLEKETHELREQNELLEFRILELEENRDKVRKVNKRIEKNRKHKKLKAAA